MRRVRGRGARAGLLAAAVCLGATLMAAPVASASARPLTGVSVNPTDPVSDATTTTTPSGSVAVTWPPDYDEDAVVPTIPGDVGVTAAADWLTNALQVRDGELSLLQAAVDGTSGLPSDLHTDLDGLLIGDSAGIETLEAVVPNETTISALQSDTAAMIVDYRVFALVTPECNSLLRAEDQLTSAKHLANLESAIESAILAVSNGTSGQLQSVESEYSSLVSKVEAADNAQIAALPGVDPSAYTASVALLATAKAALDQADKQLNAARADLRTMLADLALPGSSGSVRKATLDELRKLAG